MTNHIHLLATPSDSQGITKMMQYIGRHYVPYINHTYGGTGSIWEGRYIANLVQNDRCLSTCIRYIELNPVRADMVTSPVIKRSIQDSRLDSIMGCLISHLSLTNAMVDPKLTLNFIILFIMDMKNLTLKFFGLSTIPI
jgi:hypothetical protein